MTSFDVMEGTIKNMGLKPGRLVFKSNQVVELIAEARKDHRIDEELKDLACCLRKIHRRVNMHVRTGAFLAYESSLTLP
jgi:hypothetical protein